VVEYSGYEQVVKEISPIYHIFNTANRDVNSYYECYYYKPYNEVRLNVLSQVTEVIGDAGYGFYNGYKTYYREILDATNSNLHPFLNQAHVVNENITFFLHRQDLYDEYEKGNTFYFIHDLKNEYETQNEVLC